MSRSPIEAGLLHEQNTRSRIFVRFHGITHDHNNVQAVNSIVPAVIETFQKTHGSRIFFHEYFGLGHSEAEHLTSSMQRGGFRRFLAKGFLAQAWHRPPSDQEVDDHISRTSAMSLDELLREGVLPHEMMLEYFLLNELDRIREQFPFELRFESHSHDVNKRLEKLNQGNRQFSKNALVSWENGDFDEALANEKKGF